MLERVGPFIAGERPRASWLQQMLNALKTCLNISAAPPLKVGYGPSGFTISLGEKLAGIRRWKAVSVITSSSISGTSTACWLCKEVDTNGNVSPDLVPVFTQFTVSTNDIFQGFKPTNGTGVVYNPGTAVPVEWITQTSSSTSFPTVQVRKLGFAQIMNTNGTMTLLGTIGTATLTIPTTGTYLVNARLEHWGFYSLDSQGSDSIAVAAELYDTNGSSSLFNFGSHISFGQSLGFGPAVIQTNIGGGYLPDITEMHTLTLTAGMVVGIRESAILTNNTGHSSCNFQTYVLQLSTLRLN